MVNVLKDVFFVMKVLQTIKQYLLPETWVETLHNRIERISIYLRELGQGRASCFSALGEVVGRMVLSSALGKRALETVGPGSGGCFLDEGEQRSEEYEAGNGEVVGNGGNNIDLAENVNVVREGFADYIGNEAAIVWREGNGTVSDLDDSSTGDDIAEALRFELGLCDWDDLGWSLLEN